MGHLPNTPIRQRQGRLAALASRAAAVAMLSGCAALQIDVDVYKGPLVSEDGVQQQQLVAMAMSAKTLLYTMRNLMLDDACQGWSARITDGRRDKVISTAD